MTGLHGRQCLNARIAMPIGRGISGFALIEVVMAVSIMCIFLVSLYGLSQDTRKDLAELDRESGRLSSSDVPPAGADGTSTPVAGVTWSWGPRIRDAGWEPGPVLVASVLGQPPAPVGLWAEGWFLGKLETNGEGVIRTAGDPSGGGWFPRAGQELILRVEGDGGWGPPWRTVVPGSESSGGSGSGDGAGAGGQGTADLVIHLPTAGRGQASVESVSASDGEGAGVSGPVPLCIEVTGGQRLRVRYEGRSQSWRQEAGRDLDVIF